MKRDDRQLKRQWQAEQNAAARAALPLAESLLERLFADVAATVESQGCDHTRRVTLAWLEIERVPIAPTLSWLDDHGGFCDCEVVTNAGDHFRQVTGRR